MPLSVQLGLVLALATAVASLLGFLLKHRGAIESPDVEWRKPIRSSLRLFRSRAYALGMAVAMLSWGLHVAALSLEQGHASEFGAWRSSFVDGAGGRSVIPRMWERMRPVTDGGIVVTLDEVRRAMKLMAEKARVVAEGAGALPLAAALTGKAGEGPIVCVVSGGNVDLKKFCELIDV